MLAHNTSMTAKWKKNYWPEGELGFCEKGNVSFDPFFYYGLKSSATQATTFRYLLDIMKAWKKLSSIAELGTLMCMRFSRNKKCNDLKD